jgi:hypothetical protein
MHDVIKVQTVLSSDERGIPSAVLQLWQQLPSEDYIQLMREAGMLNPSSERREKLLLFIHCDIILKYLVHAQEEGQKVTGISRVQVCSLLNTRC